MFLQNTWDLFPDGKKAFQRYTDFLFYSSHIPLVMLLHAEAMMDQLCMHFMRHTSPFSDWKLLRFWECYYAFLFEQLHINQTLEKASGQTVCLGRAFFF